MDNSDCKKGGKSVALVLASGGSRGLAHIGAIEELEKQGYKITSISGSSMGALVGGIYAAGGLDAFKVWMKRIDKMRVFSLMDFTISTDGIVKGKKIMDELKRIVPDKNIEDLSIPFTAVSTDIKHRKEVVFSSGSLFDAIRASISIPSLFKPHKIGDMVLIDGGVINPLPLDRVARKEGDLLVAVDLNAPYEEKIKRNIKSPEQRAEERSFFAKYNIPIHHLVGGKLFSKKGDDELALYGYSQESLNYYTILNESSSLMIQTNSERSIALYNPDILISIPKNAFSTMEFYKYDEIVDMGRKMTKKSLQVFDTDAG